MPLLERVRSKDSEPPPGSSWALYRLLVKAVGGCRSELSQVVPRAQIKALLILVGGFVFCAGWSWSVAALGKSLDARGLGAWDEHWLLWIEAHAPLNFTDAILAESPGNLSYLVPLTSAVALIAFIHGRALWGLGMLAAYWGARPVVFVGWQVWNRARPDLIADGVGAPALHAFPSGHAALSTATYGFLTYLWIRSSGSWVERSLAILVTAGWVFSLSYARVRLGAHWPSDIIAGVVVALPWLIVVISSVRSAERRRSILPPS